MFDSMNYLFPEKSRFIKRFSARQEGNCFVTTGVLLYHKARDDEM